MSWHIGPEALDSYSGVRMCSVKLAGILRRKYSGGKFDIGVCISPECIVSKDNTPKWWKIVLHEVLESRQKDELQFWWTAFRNKSTNLNIKHLIIKWRFCLLTTRFKPINTRTFLTFWWLKLNKMIFLSFQIAWETPGYFLTPCST